MPATRSEVADDFDHSCRLRRGVFRPVGPVPFAEGAAVELTVAPLPSPEELARRAELVRSLTEMWAAAAAEAEDDPDDGFDIIEALNRTRLSEGRPPIEPAAYQFEP